MNISRKLLISMAGLGLCAGMIMSVLIFQISVPKSGFENYVIPFALVYGLAMAALFFGLTRWIVFGYLGRLSNILREMASGSGDLRLRMPMRKIHCANIKQCEKEDCSEFGKVSNCWDKVGSNALVGRVECPSILSGKYESCYECTVLQQAIKDEIDELTAAFNTFVGKISQVIESGLENSDKVGRYSQDFASECTQLASLAEEMNAQASTVAAAAEQSSTGVSNISTAAEETSTSFSRVAASIEEMNSSFREVVENCKRESLIAAKADEQVRLTGVVMEKLGAASNQIGSVVEVIDDVAENTSLLALNANIEAASAGEAGKGFIVVANEVKQLAKQTTEATAEIAEQIKDMQLSTESAVNAIGQITEIIEEVNAISQTIVGAVEQQSAAVAEISQGVDGANRRAEEIARNVGESAKGLSEVSSNIQGVSSASRETADGVGQINISSDELARLAVKFHEVVGQFKIA